MIHAETTEYDVLIDPENCGLTIEVKLSNGEKIETINETFSNLKVLSASFRCEVGYSVAYKILIDNQVPKNSPLWDFNGDNPWR